MSDLASPLLRCAANLDRLGIEILRYLGAYATLTHLDLPDPYDSMIVSPDASPVLLSDMLISTLMAFPGGGVESQRRLLRNGFRSPEAAAQAALHSLSRVGVSVQFSITGLELVLSVMVECWRRHLTSLRLSLGLRAQP